MAERRIGGSCSGELMWRCLEQDEKLSTNLSTSLWLEEVLFCQIADSKLSGVVSNN